LQFSSYSGFRRHLVKIHSSIGDRIVPYETPSTYENEKDNSHSLNDEIPSTSSQCQNVESGPSVSTHKKDMCASIIAKLLGSGVPNTVVLSTIENLEEFVEDLQSNIKDHVLNLVTDNNPSRPAIEELFKRLENPFSQLNTDTKWKKYFRDKWGVVEPVELRFGVRYETRRNNKTGTYEQVPVNDKFIYIPVLKTLQFIFRNENICEMMQTCTHMTYMKISVTVATLKIIHYFRLINLLSKFNYTLMSLNVQILLAPKKVFIKLVAFTLFSEILLQR